MAVNILIADDHPICAAALGMASRQVVADAHTEHVESLAAALDLAGRKRFDLVLLDLKLPDAQGFAGLISVSKAQPGVPVAIVSSIDAPTAMQQAMRHGASGYIAKSAPMSAMIAAIRALLAGGQVFPPEAFQASPQAPLPDAAARIAELSAAQLRVLRAAASGSANKQLAYELGISEPTVKTHFAQIFRKLGVTNRTQAILALQSLDVES